MFQWSILLHGRQVSSDSPHLAAYTSYIDHEIKEADPVRILCIFERALVDNCLQPDLWIRYVNYVVYIAFFHLSWLSYLYNLVKMVRSVCLGGNQGGTNRNRCTQETYGLSY